jgi:hypothetical protein
MRRCASALALLLALSASSWGQASPSPLTASPLAPSAIVYPTLAGSWATFDAILAQLEQALRDSETASKELSIKLAESQTQIVELSSLLALSEIALSASVESLTEAKALARRRGFELWIWRGASALLGVGIIAALVN